MTEKKETSPVLQIKDYQVGTAVHDGEISFICSKGDHYVVYKLKNRRGFFYRYLHANYSTESAELFAEYNKLKGEYNEKRKSAVDHRFEALMLDIMCNIFMKKDKELIELQLGEFRSLLAELKPIKQIISSTKEYVIWIDHDSVVYHVASEALTGVRQSIAEYTSLKSRASICLKGNDLSKFYQRLGAALTQAFETKPGEKYKEIFGPEEVFLHSSLTNGIRVKYLISASSITFSFILIFYLIYTVHTGFTMPKVLHTGLIPISAGFLGAYISVFERAKSFQANEQDSAGLILIQTAFRIVLGGVFGFIAYLASLANLAFGLLSHEHYSLFILGLIGGFSERLIPELIEGLGAKKEA